MNVSCTLDHSSKPVISVRSMPAASSTRDQVLLAHLHAGRRAPELLRRRARACRRRAGSRPSRAGSARATWRITSGTGTIGAHMSIARRSISRVRSRRPSALGAAAIPGSFASAIVPSPSVVRFPGRAPRRGARPLPARPCARGSPRTSRASRCSRRAGASNFASTSCRRQPAEEQALGEERMTEQEVVGDLVALVVRAREPLLEHASSLGGRMEHVPVAAAPPALDALAHQARRPRAASAADRGSRRSPAARAAAPATARASARSRASAGRSGTRAPSTS